MPRNYDQDDNQDHEGFMRNTPSEDKNDMYRPTPNEKFMIHQAGRKTLDSAIGTLNVGKVADYEIDAKFKEEDFRVISRARVFRAYAQRVDMDLEATLGTLGYAGKTDQRSLEVREALTREMTNDANKRLFELWKGFYDMETKNEHGVARVDVGDYNFKLGPGQE